MSTPHRRGELLAKYLTSRPSAPLYLRPAKTTRPLLEMAGGAVVVKGHRWRGAYPYWRAHLNGDPMLAAWLDTEQAFRAPAQWPVAGLPPHVTPLEFALAFLPAGDHSRLGGHMNHAPHLDVLAAWAHGWPVPKRRWPDMEVATDWLSHDALFNIWAFDLDLTGVPLPFHDSVGYMRRLRARARLESNPLSCGDHTLGWALPQSLMDSLYNLGRLPRRSAGVGPSTKWPNLKLDSPSPAG